MFNRIGRVLSAVAAAVGLSTLAAKTAPPPNQFKAADPVKRNKRQPVRLPGWATLIWDSSDGPAYRVHDAQGRSFYTALKSIPPARRVPRRTRRYHEAGCRRAATA